MMKITDYFENCNNKELVICDEVGNHFKLIKNDTCIQLVIKRDYKRIINDLDEINNQWNLLISNGCILALSIQRDLLIDNILNG